MKRALRDGAFILLGSFFLAVGLNVFFVPFRFSSGGIGTVGVILLSFFGIPLSVTSLVANAVLIGLGYRLLPKDLIVKTGLGILLLSLFLEWTAHFPAFYEDSFLAMAIGGVLDGIGMGLVLKANASTGGIDFCAFLVKKRLPQISMPNFIFTVNSVLLLFSGFLYQSYAIAFYSIIAMFLSSRITDAMLAVGERAKAIEILSDNVERIKEMILNDFGRGATEIYAKGAFSSREKKLLLCVAKPKEVSRIVQAVKAIDRSAFLMISDVHEVWGEGFKM